MDMRSFGIVLLAAVAIGAVSGCTKSPPRGHEAADSPDEVRPAESSGNTIASLHWLGKKRLAGDTNATHLMSIWNLPESVKLGQQTLDKLALAPWRLLKGDSATNGAPTALLRPLLEDLVQEESYLEVRDFTNQPGEIVFSIRLGPEQAATWQTNLAVVFESLTGQQIASMTGGWSLKRDDAPEIVEFTRQGEWTIMALAQNKHNLMAETLARIEQTQMPFAVPATNHWLTLLIDLPRLVQAFSLNCQLPTNLPSVSFSVVGDGANVQTRGELDFPTPLELELEPWNIPTNFVHDPLISFTAIRGLRQWLPSTETWQKLKLGESPDQFYLWGLGATPFQTYFAMPSESASNQVFLLSQFLMDKGNAWLLENAIGQIARLDSANGVRWTGLPFIVPVLQSVSAGDAHFIKGGFFPTPGTNKPMPIELVYALLTQTNLVVYDWEITAPRFDGWTGVGQALRIGFDRPRMPAASAGVVWLRTIKAKLGNSTTGVLLGEAGELKLVRTSTLGLNAMELHLLADWLESPEFPRGLHTLLSPSELPWRKSASPPSQGQP